MERLTRKDKCKLSHGEDIIICNHDKQDCNDSCMRIKPCKWYKKVLEKLWEYENEEEQGLLLRLPCKVGDNVYYILGIPKETPCVIENCTFELSDIHRIGKTLFLTQAEAEQKLKEMESE